MNPHLTTDRPAPSSELFAADVGALLEAAGLRLLVREERPHWLQRKQALFERVVAEDSENAEPALHSLADGGRRFLAGRSRLRRLLLVTSIAGSRPKRRDR